MCGQEERYIPREICDSLPLIPRLNFNGVESGYMCAIVWEELCPSPLGHGLVVTHQQNSHRE